jgi:hypothetical protein
MLDDRSCSRDEIPVLWLPFLIIAFVFVLVIVTALFYAFGDSHAPGPCPTLSYAAMGFPANRFFAVGLALLSFLLIILCIFESDVFRLWDSPMVSNLIFYTSCATGTLFFLTGQINLGEIPDVHSLLSFFAFVTLLVVNLLSVIGEIRTDKERLTGVKLCCIIVPMWNLIGLAVASRLDETALQFAIFGIFEYIVVLGGCVGVALYFLNLRNVQVVLCVEMPPDDPPGDAAETSELSVEASPN